jgi:hypothetical protein
MSPSPTGEASARWAVEAMNPRRARPAYAAATIAIVCAGLICRWPGLGLPWTVAKYAGSALWGAMVYAGLRALRPRSPLCGIAIAACAIAIGVECLRLYHQAALDAFRATLAGQLLLGRLFSLWNLVAYGFGIGVAAFCDLQTLRRRLPKVVKD